MGGGAALGGPGARMPALEGMCGCPATGCGATGSWWLLGNSTRAKGEAGRRTQKTQLSLPSPRRALPWDASGGATPQKACTQKELRASLAHAQPDMQRPPAAPSHSWVSVSPDLIKDAERDLRDVGAGHTTCYPHKVGGRVYGWAGGRAAVRWMHGDWRVLMVWVGCGCAGLCTRRLLEGRRVNCRQGQGGVHSTPEGALGCKIQPLLPTSLEHIRTATTPPAHPRQGRRAAQGGRRAALWAWRAVHHLLHPHLRAAPAQGREQGGSAHRVSKGGGWGAVGWEGRGSTEASTYQFSAYQGSLRVAPALQCSSQASARLV